MQDKREEVIKLISENLEPWEHRSGVFQLYLSGEIQLSLSDERLSGGGIPLRVIRSGTVVDTIYVSVQVYQLIAETTLNTPQVLDEVIGMLKERPQEGASPSIS